MPYPATVPFAHCSFLGSSSALIDQPYDMAPQPYGLALVLLHAVVAQERRFANRIGGFGTSRHPPGGLYVSLKPSETTSNYRLPWVRPSIGSLGYISCTTLCFSDSPAIPAGLRASLARRRPICLSCLERAAELRGEAELPTRPRRTATRGAYGVDGTWRLDYLDFAFACHRCGINIRIAGGPSDSSTILLPQREWHGIQRSSHFWP